MRVVVLPWILCDQLPFEYLDAIANVVAAYHDARDAMFREFFIFALSGVEHL